MSIGAITKLAKLVPQIISLFSANGPQVIPFTQTGIEATLWTLADKLSESISVKDYMTPAQWADANSTAPAMNHSPAFVKAMAAAVIAGSRRVLVPPVLGYYNVANVAVPDDIGLYGYSCLPYTAFTPAGVLGVGSAIVMIAGAAAMFTWGARNTAEGIVFHGRDRSQDTFKPTGALTTSLRLRWCGMYRFNRGIGTLSYIAGVVALECNVSGNSVGIANIVDSRVVGCYVNANEGNGVSLLTGANDNAFSDTKNEWNNGNNWEFYASGNNTVSGGVADRAGDNNFKIGANAGVVIGDVCNRRAGRLVTTGRNYLVESASKVHISNSITNLGANDDGSGTSSPGTSVLLRGPIGSLVMSGIDMRGGVTNNLSIEAGTTFEYLAIRDCPGVKDQFNRPGDMSGGLSVPAASTVNFPIKLNPVITYSGGVSRVVVYARNNTGGGDITGSAILGVQREGAGASALPPILDWAGGSFGVAGSETISVSMVNVAADGSTAELAFKNSHVADAFAITVTLSRLL